jgi:hypothetical protein
VQVALGGQLGDPVGGDGVLRVVLGRRKLLLLTVDRPTSGGEDDPFDAVAGAVLEELDRTDRINLRVEVRLAY